MKKNIEKWKKQLVAKGWRYNRDMFMWELKKEGKIVARITDESLDAATNKSEIFYHVYRELGCSPIQTRAIVEDIFI